MSDERVEVADRATWRAWLAEHHDDREVAWLVYRKGGGGIAYGESVEEALCYGWVDGLVRRIDEQRYMRRFTPRKAKSTWSASNKKRVAALQKAGRIEEPGRRVIDAAKKDGSWDQKPDAEKTWAMPAELEAVLKGKVKRAFEGLTAAHKKQFVIWIASAKREETRQRRAAKAEGMILAGERPM